MQDYSVPQHHNVWTSRIPAWLAWTLTLVIGGTLAESLTPFLTFNIVDFKNPFFVVVSVYTLIYIGIFIFSLWYGFQTLAAYKLGSFLMWFGVGIPLALMFFFGFREDAFSTIADHMFNAFLGLIIGLWIGAWFTTLLPLPMSIDEKIIWVAIHSFSLASCFFFFSIIVTKSTMGETKTFDTYSFIFYIAHAIKWLIYALPTGVLFQWMLQRQNKR